MSNESLQHDSPALEGSLVAGKYRVLRLIGSGGMGTVWEGVHETLGTRVAIKFIKPSHAQAADARKRFEIEARAAAKLQSKHAVNVYDYGVNEAGLPYIVMEYLQGESLSDMLIRRGPLPPREVAVVIGQASKALGKAHKAGIVHRDLKPDNIFLQTTDGETMDGGIPYSVKLVDFGIAKMLDVPIEGQKAAPMGGPTQDGAVIGTPNFMAPEQLTVGGAPTPLTDLWSLGACAFAAMIARIPFEGEVLGDIVLKVCAAPLPVPSKLNPGVPAGFDAWFARACNRDASKRFQTADELAEALANVCGTGRVRVATMSEDQVQYQLKPSTPDLAALAEEIEVPKSMSPKTALMAGLVLGVTMMIGILGAIAWRDKQREQEQINLATSTSASVAPPPSVSAAPPPSVTVAPSASATTAPTARATTTHSRSAAAAMTTTAATSTASSASSAAE
ncbi:MAG TPA: serine/threonine-protein kinase [Polyangiaceae bacterium]|jgi:serine/threonine-protein kinase